MSRKRTRNEEAIDENILRTKRMCNETKSMRVIVDEDKLAERSGGITELDYES